MSQSTKLVRIYTAVVVISCTRCGVCGLLKNAANVADGADADVVASMFSHGLRGKYGCKVTGTTGMGERAALKAASEHVQPCSATNL